MPLTERRKGDREKMFQILTETLCPLGATVELERLEPRCISVRVRVPGGAVAMFDFDGTSPQIEPDTFVVSWYIDYQYRGQRFALTFGDVNAFHRAKASRVVYGFDALLECLTDDVNELMTGDGYEVAA